MKHILLLFIIIIFIFKGLSFSQENHSRILPGTFIKSFPGRVALYPDIARKEKPTFTTKIAAYNVTAIEMYEGILMLRINYTNKNVDSNLEGFVSISPLSRNSLRDDESIPVFFNLFKDGQITNNFTYETYPKSSIFSKEGENIININNNTWYPVEIRNKSPLVMWVREKDGIFRPDAKASHINELLRLIRRGFYKKEDASNLLLGIIRPGYSLQSVKLSLGEPSSRSDEKSDSFTLAFGDRIFLFSNDEKIRKIVK